MHNYIITIHNREDVLGEVLAGVDRCAGRDALIIPVLDGCTDRSELVVDEFTKRTGRNIKKVFTPDVHEILAINAGMASAGDGYLHILQDDVVLLDPDYENKIELLNSCYNGKIGYISLRMGGCIKRLNLLRRLKFWITSGGRVKRQMLDVYNIVGSVHDSHPVDKKTVISDDCWLEVESCIKSPVCFTPALRSIDSTLDGNLAPYCYDDLDLSIRSRRAGLVNIVYALKYKSDIKWGGTRKSIDFKTNAGRIILRNRAYLYDKHKDYLF